MNTCNDDLDITLTPLQWIKRLNSNANDEQPTTNVCNYKLNSNIRKWLLLLLGRYDSLKCQLDRIHRVVCCVIHLTILYFSLSHFHPSDFPSDIKLICITFPINSLNHNLVVSNCDYVMNPIRYPTPSRGNNFKFFNHFMWFWACVSFWHAQSDIHRSSEMWISFFLVLPVDGGLRGRVDGREIKQFLLFTTKCDIIVL